MIFYHDKFRYENFNKKLQFFAAGKIRLCGYKILIFLWFFIEIFVTEFVMPYKFSVQIAIIQWSDMGNYYTPVHVVFKRCVWEGSCEMFKFFNQFHSGNVNFGRGNSTWVFSHDQFCWKHGLQIWNPINLQIIWCVYVYLFNSILKWQVSIV